MLMSSGPRLSTIFVLTPPSVNQSNCAFKAERLVRDGTLSLNRAVHFLELICNLKFQTLSKLDIPPPMESFLRRYDILLLIDITKNSTPKPQRGESSGKLKIIGF